MFSYNSFATTVEPQDILTWPKKDTIKHLAIFIPSLMLNKHPLLSPWAQPFLKLPESHLRKIAREGQQEKKDSSCLLDNTSSVDISQGGIWTQHD